MRLFASVAVLLLLVSACGVPALRTATPGPAVSSFEDDVLSFEYPANWNALVPESGDRALVLLSTEPLATTEPRVAALGEDGVYIAFTEVAAAPLPSPNPSFGSEVEVGGRRAIITQTVADGDCASLGGEQLLLVTFDSPGSSPDVRMQGCVHGPNFELTGATIAGMLASVEWKN